MNHKFFMVLVTLLFTSVASFAKFTLEPSVGYHMGTIKSKYVDLLGGTDNNGTANGVQYGVGLGYQFSFKLILGLDYTMATLDEKGTDEGASSSTTKLSQSVYYGTIGYGIGNGGKVGLGYGNHTGTEDSSTKPKLTGTAMKIFGGWEFLNHVAVNLEYIMYTLVDITPDGGTTVKASDAFQSFTNSAIAINFSFPFHFGGK